VTDAGARKSADAGSSASHHRGKRAEDRPAQLVSAARHAQRPSITAIVVPAALIAWIALATIVEPSRHHDASIRPSGENAIDSTLSVWPVSVRDPVNGIKINVAASSKTAVTTARSQAIDGVQAYPPAAQALAVRPARLRCQSFKGL
jgi:hypothetical protein